MCRRGRTSPPQLGWVRVMVPQKRVLLARAIGGQTEGGRAGLVEARWSSGGRGYADGIAGRRNNFFPYTLSPNIAGLAHPRPTCALDNNWRFFCSNLLLVS